MSFIDPKPLNGGRPIPTIHEWEGHRPLITMLYLDENRTLKEVMEYMSINHNFYASPRMFKRKFENWKLDRKYVRASIAIAVYQDAPDSSADSAIVTVEGRQFDTLKIRRHLQRKSQDILRLRASAQRTKALTPQKLRSPDDLRFAEKLLSTLAPYIDGSFQAGIWTIDPTYDRLFSTNQHKSAQKVSFFKDKFSEGLQLLRLRRSKIERPALRLIDEALQNLQSNIETETPGFLSDLAYALALCRADDRPEIGRMVSKYAVELSSCLLGKEHPMTLLAMGLHIIILDSKLDVLLAVIALWRAKWEEYLLLQSTTTYLYHSMNLDDILYIIDLDEEHQLMVQSLLQIPSLEKGSKMWLQLQKQFAEALGWQSKWTEAEEVYRTLLECIEADKVYSWERHIILLFAGQNKLEIGSRERGKELIWQSVCWAEECWGPLDPDSLDTLDEYVNYFPEDLSASGILEERLTEITGDMCAMVLE
ncbi:hypothetical protein GQ53DRAFT_835423 [Thozetella sp. PMI_491]|nr:hypothetical protein GQ53DRAFT_835423 [Thozetella sp. PMI_491]